MRPITELLEVPFAVLNPEGEREEVLPSALTARLASLDGKVVYCVSQYIGGADVLLKKIADMLPQYAPGVKTVFLRRETAYMADEPSLWTKIIENADAFIYGCGACGSCSMWGTHWTVELEKKGVPGVFIVDVPFQADVHTTSVKEGMSAMRRVVVPHPCDNIPDGEMVDIVNALIDRLTTPLTDNERFPPLKQPRKNKRVAFQGSLCDVNRFFERRGWSDGLPIMPPTERAVAAMLDHTRHAPDVIVAEKFHPESLRVNVEKVATVGVMAGCDPAYMPVLLAVVEAISDARFASSVRSTTSFSFAVFGNGPFPARIGMNSGGNALGSGTGNKANATIGRFLRLALICLGGSRTGISDLSSIGNPTKYSMAFAENESASPWQPYHVDNGYRADESVVTVMSGGWSYLSPFARMMGDLHLGLDSMAEAIARFELPGGALLLMDPIVARKTAAAGFSKAAAEEYIWTRATRTAGEFRHDYFYTPFIEPSLRGKSVYSKTSSWPESHLTAADDQIIQVFPKGDVRILVVGGETNPMAQAWQFARPSSVVIDKWI